MTIPAPNLDDRSFQDIVDEAKRQIPDRFPDWTNHNISDPGVALIELFAWMTEMTLNRLNQLPKRAMITLLNTVGFQTLPAFAASADLTFHLTTSAKDTLIVVPAGTQVGTVGAVADQVIFETDEDLILRQPQFVRCIAMSPTDSPIDKTATVLDSQDSILCFDGLDEIQEKWEDALDLLTRNARRHWRPSRRFGGDALYFGFTETLAGALLHVEINASGQGLGIDPENPPLIWEVSTSRGYAKCECTADTTGGLNQVGIVELEIPPDHTALTLAGEDFYWIRLRVDTERCPMYRRSPSLTSIRFGTVGGIARAHHAEQRPGEVLGISNGKPGQRFTLSSAPVLPRPAGRDGANPSTRFEGVLVGDEQWHEVEDFTNMPLTELNGSSTPRKVYTLDPTTGEIAFGPQVFAANGKSTQYGAIPKEGSVISYTQYRVGGGVRGNVPAYSISNLRTTIKLVDPRVENRHEATGGIDAETYEQALERAPLALRAGERAVTAADHVRIVRDAARDLVRVDARPPSVPGAPLRLLLVPKISAHESVQTIDDYALPKKLTDEIEKQLESRRLIGSSVTITTPYYLGLSVAARVVGPSSNAVDPVALSNRITEALYRFINPIIGGEHHDGLPYDAPMTGERVKSYLLSLDGVTAVEVELFEADLRSRQRIGTGQQRIALPPDTLFLSFHHRVVLSNDQAVRR
jgi:predicted phage baseplate assembly protein